MSKTKLTAKIFSFLSRVLAIGYLTSVVYSIVCLVNDWCITPYGEGKYLHINYPFSTIPFLNIDNNINYMLFSFLLPVTLYGVFFWLVSDLFLVFSKPKLFTIANLLQLRKFYLFNWLAPFPASIVSSFFVEVESAIWLLALLHAILGIFTWMVAAIFEQGLQLQNEQDLII